MNKKSAQKTLGRVPPMVPAILNSYQRAWSFATQVYSEDLSSVVSVAFLDIAPIPQSSLYLNGVVISITDEELEKLKSRERGYDLVDVTDKIIIERSSKTSYFAFVSKQEAKVVSGHKYYVMLEYKKLIDEALSELGKKFTEDYDLTTRPHDFEILGGNYLFNV